MIYKFFIGSEEAENFKLEIAIDASDTFMRLRNAILDAVGFNRGQMDSFYICDSDWNKQQEVTYMDMGSDSDEDIWLMDETAIEELVEDEGQRLKFVFDYLTERYLYMRLKETLPGKNLSDPLCQRKEGRPPKETIDFESLDIPAPAKIDSTLDIGEDFFGEDEFNDDELADFGEFTDDTL